MFRLASMIYTIASGTIMGIFIVVALVAGYDTLRYIVIAAAAGAVVALPVSWYIARAIKALD